MVNWMEIRLEAATPVQALVKKPREESGQPHWNPFFFLAFLPPTLIPSFFLFLGRMSVNRKWEELRQIGWPLVGARAESDPKLWEESRTHPSPRPWGSIHNQTLETKCTIPAPRVKQDWNQKAGCRDQRLQLGNGVRMKAGWYQSERSKRIVISPGWCGSVDWMLDWEAKGHRFGSWLGHMSESRTRPPIQGVRGNGLMFLSISVSLPLFLPPFPSL